MSIMTERTLKHGEFFITLTEEGESKLYQWNDIFEKEEAFDPAEYLATVLDIEYELKRLDNETPQQRQDAFSDPTEFYKSRYIGSCFRIYPSGKFYMPWSTNVSEPEAMADEMTREYLEKELEKHNAWLEAGEGDATDLFIMKRWELPEKIAAMLDDDGNFKSHSDDFNFVGYPLFYVIEKQLETVCHSCADKVKHEIVAADVNYENHDMYCGHCGNKIEAAYEE
jgi:hypothetical protein